MNRQLNSSDLTSSNASVISLYRVQKQTYDYIFHINKTLQNYVL